MAWKGKKKVTFKLIEHTQINAVIIFLKKLVSELENEQTVILKSQEQDIEIRPQGPIDLKLKVKEDPKREGVNQKFVLELEWKAAKLPVGDEWELVGEPLTVLPGISFETIEKLQAKHIETTTQFLKHAQESSVQQEFARDLNLSESLITSWVTFCNFLRIKAMTATNAEILMNAGIATVKDLAQATVDTILEKVTKLDHDTSALTAELVGKYIDRAKKLDRIPQ